MLNKNGFNYVVLLLLVGIYFILNYFAQKQLTDLIYGIILVIYHIKFRFLNKNVCK